MAAFLERLAADGVLVRRYPLFKKNYAANLAMLERVVRACKNRGLHPVLLDLPRNKAVIGSRLDAPVSRYQRSCKALAAEYDIPWVNFNPTAGLVNSDFYDLWHLVTPGQQKWQDRLAAKTAFLLQQYAGKLQALVLTHGHEDHIGAVPHVLPYVNGPVYGTPFTLALVEPKLEEHGVDATNRLRAIRPRETVTAGPFRIEFLRVTHSMPDCVALAVHTPAGTLTARDTEFSVELRPADEQGVESMSDMALLLTVAVLTGQVEVQSKGQNFVLAPGESWVFAADEKVKEKKHNLQIFFSFLDFFLPPLLL